MTLPSCQPFRERFTALADSELTETEAVQTREHLAVCAACQAEWSAHTALYALLETSEPAPTGDITDAVLSRLPPLPVSLSDVLNEVRMLRDELQAAHGEIQTLRREVARLHEERKRQAAPVTGPYLLPYAAPNQTPALPLSPGTPPYA